MDEIIEKIKKMVQKDLSGMTPEEKAFVYNELANEMVTEASNVLMDEYAIEDEL